jgi:hypothetical protein
MRRFTRWLFASPQSPPTAWKVVAWWEVRRIPFNIIVGTYGVLCLVAFFWAIGTSGHLQEGEDAVEPIALLAAPFAINALYTLGWLVEAPARLANPALPLGFGSMLLKLGLSLGLGLITLPAAFWVGWRILQIGGLVR